MLEARKAKGAMPCSFPCRSSRPRKRGEKGLRLAEANEASSVPCILTVAPSGDLRLLVLPPREDVRAQAGSWAPGHASCMLVGIVIFTFFSNVL